MKWPQKNARAWRGASVCVLFFSLFVLFSDIFDSLSGPQGWLYSTLTSLTGTILLLGLGFIVVGLFKAAQKFPWHYQIACSIAIFVINFTLPANSAISWALCLTGLIIFPTILGSSLTILFTKKRENIPLKQSLKPLTALTLSLIGLSYISYWLIDQGKTDLSLPTVHNTEITPLALSNPALPGPYAVKTLYYGSGKDSYRSHFGKQANLITNSVDASAFILGWNEWTGWLRSYFWGFNAADIPLNAQVWMPEGPGPFPLILIIHGNHTMNTFSDGGYTYLGNLLASQGFITASIDENFLNTNYFDLWSDFNETAARGWLILKHLSLWREWNSDTNTPFFRKVDMNAIGLIGHSRGGEAIVTAKAFNELPFFPENGSTVFDFNFSIKALAAIAPTDGQYLPSGLATPLKNVNYFTMHGSHDGDVRSFEGAKTYSRLIFDDGNDWFKSALYIVAANHGQFNEIWGNIDTSLPESLFLNLKPLLSDSQQHTIAEVYLSAFMQASLKNRREYIPLFWDARLGQTWLPNNTLFLNQFEDSKASFLYANKTDLNITLGTLAGTTISQNNLILWKQQKTATKWGGKFNLALFAGWEDRIGSLTLTLPTPNPLSTNKNSVLVFSAADADEKDISETQRDLDDQVIDFTIELTDTLGQVATLPLSHNSYLFQQIHANVYKAVYFDTVDDSEAIFQTFRLPLADFLTNNPNLNPSKLRSLRFIFDRTPKGVVAFDHIGFESPEENISNTVL